MRFHVEERRAWFRPETHTIVFDRDPEFERLEGDHSGSMKRLLRIWLAERSGERPELRAYLGGICLSDAGSSLHELLRLFRRASDCAGLAGVPAAVLRRRLSRLLRARMSA